MWAPNDGHIAVSFRITDEKDNRADYYELSRFNAIYVLDAELGLGAVRNVATPTMCTFSGMFFSQEGKYLVVRWIRRFVDPLVKGPFEYRSDGQEKIAVAHGFPLNSGRVLAFQVRRSRSNPSKCKVKKFTDEAPWRGPKAL